MYIDGIYACSWGFLCKLWVDHSRIMCESYTQTFKYNFTKKWELTGKVSFRNLWQERSPRTHVQYTGHCLVKQVVSTFSEHMLFWKNSELDISLPPCGLNNALYSRWLNLALVVRTSLLNMGIYITGCKVRPWANCIFPWPTRLMLLITVLTDLISWGNHMQP